MISGEQACCVSHHSQTGLSGQTNIEQFVQEFGGALQHLGEVEEFVQDTMRCSDRDAMGQGLE